MIANIATDAGSGNRYNSRMVGKPRYPKPPLTPINQWVRDAIAASEITQTRLADELTARMGVSYTKFTVRDMTTTRKISAQEASAIMAITGHPLPVDTALRDQQEVHLIRMFRELPPEQRELWAGLLEKAVDHAARGDGGTDGTGGPS